jgi:hypothetical protein
VRRAARAGFVLPVVLILIGILALIMAGFMFFVRAELAGAQAQRDGQQARLAARSGMQELIMVLREAGSDMTAWWDVPEQFRHRLVWSEAFEREDDPLLQASSRQDYLDEQGVRVPPAWRYSVVAVNYDNDGVDDTIRYGITPEAGKLNVNAASEAELERLLTPLLTDLRFENAPELIAALLDWLDEDGDPRVGGAESEDYYNLLEPGYYAKNGPIDTLEELLLVKGFSAGVLYGEDVNRNGLLDPNEDDGDASFPFYDNSDGVLDRGIAPYLTVWSREPDDQGNYIAGRINVLTAPPLVLGAIEGMTPEGVDAIVGARAELAPEALDSTEWLLTAGVPPDVYSAVQDRLTVQAFQFHVEILGYADHLRLARRYEWILEMRGTLAQVLYHRELTGLGFAWPINNEDYLRDAP